MAQKFFEPFKKLPQKIQNLPWVQKFQDFTTGKHTEQPHCYNASTYGIIDDPVCLAYDQDLCLLAVAYARGRLVVYGAPGLSFPVDFAASEIGFIQFLRNEGRLVVSTGSKLVMLELDAETGHWRQKCSVELPFSKEEGLTALAVGRGIIYIGSTSGTLRQVAVHNGCMTVGEDELNSLSTHIILTKVPDAQRQQLNLPSTIVSIEVDPTGNHLVIGYAGGTAVIAEPQPVPVTGETPAPTEAVEAALPTDTKAEPAPGTASSEPQVDAPTEVQPQQLNENGHASEKSKEESSAPSESGPVTEKAVSEKEGEEKTGTGDKRKDHLQAMRAEATKKFRTLSKTLRNTLMDRSEEKPTEPPIPVPPSPRVTHILPYTQALCCASWHIASLEPGHPLQVIVAYDDGAHLTWKIPTPEGTQEDPMICTNQENATIPYGPLPCAPIRKIMTRPSTNGGVITVIVGGLPRAEHSDKHTVSVIGSVDEHVCFQFGSPVRDFVILPPHSGKSSGPEAASTEPESAEQQQPPADEAAAVEGAASGATETHCTLPATPTEPGYLLVLTERELVAIDLTQPSWPVLPSPYLGCLGCSAVTASAHIALPVGLMKRLHSCGRVSQGCPFKDWPINGGVLDCPAKAANKEGETPADAHCSASLARNASNDILALGHANGDVSLWALGRGDFLRCLCHVHVFSLLEAGDACQSEHKTEYAAWPPFRRVGDCTGSCCIDSTDPRVAVRTLSLQLSENAEELILLAGGGAGQVVQWTTASIDGHFEPDVSRLQVDLLATVNAEDPSFVWEGQPALKACEGVFAPCPTACPLFMPQGLVQLEPPSAITAVAWEPRWHALAVGSAYGFALIDLKTHSVVYNRFTCGLTFADDQPAGAAKKIAASGRQLKATLRQSFRKLRKPRVSAPARVSTETEPKKSDGEAAPEAAPGDAGDETIAGTASAVVDEAIHSAETAAVESKASRSEQEEEEPGAPSEEAQHTEVPSSVGPHVLKPTDAALSTSVHCLSFADTFIVSPVPAKEGRPAVPSTRVPTLWVGTYGGAALAHRLSWPAAPAGPISVNPVKELQLKHAAPVLGVCVLDAKSHVPLGPTEKNRLVAELIEEPATEAPAKTEDQPAESVASPDKPAEEKAPEAEEKAAALSCPESHELLICTEEQVKVFALPSLRPKHKYRFWSKPVSAMGTANQPQSTTTGEEQSQVPPAEVSAATAEAPTEPSQEAVSSPAPAEEKTEEHVTEATEVTCQKTCRQHARGRVAAFGLQQFPCSSHATGSSNASGSASEEWHIVLALQNGCINALSLANLRRDLKAYCCSQSDYCADKLLTPCVCNHANLVFWPLSTGQVVANELSCIPPQRLASVLLTTPGITGPGYCIQLPEWARPAVKSVVEAATEAAEAAATQVVEEVTEAVKVATEAVAEPVSEVAKTAISAVEDTVATVTTSLELGANSIAQQVGDITMDSIKEYLNDSGAVTVKTTENSLEKRTIIEGGHVMTTVHETERVDGEIVKDDIVQVKSTNEAEPSAISGQA